jgi:hypothetical protein
MIFLVSGLCSLVTSIIGRILVGGQGFMSWEMLAAVGQLAAVLIGIPSIIYLAVQIRAQTRERRLSAANALTVQWGDLTRSLHDSPEFSAIFLRGVQSFSHLDAVSKLRWIIVKRSRFQFVKGTPRRYQNRDGSVEDFFATGVEHP